MMIAPLLLTWPNPVQSAESRKRPKRPDCPHCGSRLLVAEQSRFNLAGRFGPATFAALNLRPRSR